MKKSFKSVLAVAATAVAVAGIAAIPALVSAYGPERAVYSLQQINDPKTLDGKVTFNSIVLADTDNDWYKSTHNGNSIPAGTIQDERNFVGAREDVPLTGAYYDWEGNNIEVEDGKTYVVRMYVHNNSISTAAQNVRAKFFMSEGYDTKQSIDGQITASNAMYAKYWDYVNFTSKDGTPFKLEFVSGSANLTNNVFTSQNGGYNLGDEILTSNDGVQIGYDSMNGVVPGCYQYDAYITIKVKATYEPKFTVEKHVRIANSEDKTWQKTINANVGDIVEFQVEYTNTNPIPDSNDQAAVDKATQYHVALRDLLPKSLEFVDGSVIYYNSAFKNGFVPDDQEAFFTNGFDTGSYRANANVILRFKAKVVDTGTLTCGSNTLVNWGQASANGYTKQDYARVVVNKVCENNPTPEEPKTNNPVDELPTTGPEAVAGGIIAVGSITTATGYFIVSRRQLR